MWMRDATRKEKLPTIARARAARGTSPIATARRSGPTWPAASATRSWARRWQALRPAVNDAGEILQAVVGVDEKTLSKEWHAALRAAAEPQIVGRKAAADVTDRRSSPRRGRAATSTSGPRSAPTARGSPSSPSATCSRSSCSWPTRKTGEVTRRLSRQAVDPHLESLQFINSAGAWDRDGKRVALGAVSKGRPLLVILDARSGRRACARCRCPPWARSQTPSFSPDGKRVVFAALAGGFTDLFVYDLEAGALRRLTEDAYADLQPAWSPDGTPIAFTTDRFSTDLATLDTGQLPPGRRSTWRSRDDPRRCPRFTGGQEHQPAVDAAPATAVYFLSDAGGATNVYRLDVADGALFQLTDLDHRRQRHHRAQPRAERRPRARTASPSACTTSEKLRDLRHRRPRAPGRMAGGADGRRRTRASSPARKPPGEVLAAHADRRARPGRRGRVRAEARTRPSSASTTWASRPSAPATGRYGGFVSGGIAMSFSDMLGEHTLDTILQADSVRRVQRHRRPRSSYMNRVHRFNWGVQVGADPVRDGRLRHAASPPAAASRSTWSRRYCERQMDRTRRRPRLSTRSTPSLRAGGAGRLPQHRLRHPRATRKASRAQRAAGHRRGGDASMPATPSTCSRARWPWCATPPCSAPRARSSGQRLRFDVSPVLGSRELHRRPGGLPPVRDAGAAGHRRRPRPALRPLRVRRRRPAAGIAVPRLPEPRARLRHRLLHRRGVRRRPAPAPCTTSCWAAGMLVGNLEVRAPLLGLFGAKRLYGPAARGDRRLLRRRRGLGHGPARRRSSAASASS